MPSLVFWMDRKMEASVVNSVWFRDARAQIKMSAWIFRKVPHPFQQCFATGIRDTQPGLGPKHVEFAATSF